MKNYTYLKPVNFDETNPEFDIFKNPAEEEYFEPEIKFLKNVRISSNSVVFNYFKIFRESCIKEENYQKYRQGFRFFLKFIFPKFNFSRKKFLLITDEWTSNYYHWHVFALKKLLILKEKKLLENSLLFLPKKYQSYPFVIPSLERFGIKKEQIVFLRRKSNIKVAELALVNAPKQHQIYFQKIREILSTKVSGDERIYISREKQVLRFVENEQEVGEVLAKYGFKKIIAEELSYEEQINIFSKTKYLISPHGAGLTNIFSMPKNSAILELAAELPTLDYYKLSTFLEIKYFYQKCDFGSRSKIKDPHHGSLLVDLDKLENNLKLMLK
ncbi:MAG: DUF563 domain-containing protein [Proteobacteria bacterium]|nr:DUF563 domain-containing protein [Pseudomonadota bacterium]